MLHTKILILSIKSTPTTPVFCVLVNGSTIQPVTQDLDSFYFSSCAINSQILSAILFKYLWNMSILPRPSITIFHLDYFLSMVNRVV